MVAAVTGCRHLLDPLLGEHHPFVLSLAATFIAAWYGGWRPGLLALGLGLLVADYLFIHPRGVMFGGGVEQTTGMAINAVVGSGIVGLVEALRRATRRLELHAGRLDEEIAGHHRTQEALRQAQAELERRVDQRTAQLREETTARRDAEGRLRRMAALVASSEDAIIGKTLDGTITEWNVGAEHLFGFSPDEILGRTAGVLVPPDRQEELTRLTERVLRGEDIPPYETVRVRKDGHEFPVSVRISPIKENGRVVGVSSINRDLTPTRALQEQLRQSQKMEAVGQLAGGIAHDFNNLLTIITGYSEMLLADGRPDDPAYDLLDEIRKAGERAATLTRQLLVFSRKQVLDPKVVDLNGTVRDAEKMLRRLIGEDVRLTTTLATGLGHVKVDPGQVEQAIMNLAVNARDAMPTGGMLTIETADVELDEAYATANPEVWPGRYVLLAVSDTGSGMDAATRAKIFEPFFTTKGVGKGTGLGLAVVHGFVRQSGGHVAVYTELGRGTTFKIYLPAVEGIRAAGKSHPGTVTATKGAETVLLVEDERAVRGLATQVLRAAGYTVLEAAHGGEAIRLAETYGGPIHLLVSDVVMPEMGGRILAERLSAARPGVKLLFVSGYTDDAVVRHGVLEAEMAFLQKPFTPAALAGKVRQVLDGTPTFRRATMA
jgi:PAS domain S-box-containing protein